MNIRDLTDDTPEDEKQPSVRDDLEAAFAEVVTEDPGDDNADSGAKIDNTVDDTADAGEKTADRAETGPDRDEKGRFKAKDPAPAAEKPSADAAPAAPEQAVAGVSDQPSADTEASADAPALAAPDSWSISAKAAFGGLPPEVQQAIAKREQEVADGFSRYQDIRLAEIEPHVQYAQSVNETLPSLLDKYRAAETLLEEQPMQGVLWIMQTVGVTPADVAAQAGITFAPTSGEQTTDQHGNLITPQTPDLSALQPVMDRINKLETGINQERQARQTEKQQSAEQALQAFIADPAHPFASNLQGEMSTLIQMGKAKTLQEAYDLACWMNPEARAVLVAQQAGNAPPQNGDPKANADQKRAASTSINGSAPGGGSPTENEEPAETVRAELTRQMAAAGLV